MFKDVERSSKSKESDLGQIKRRSTCVHLHPRNKETCVSGGRFCDPVFLSPSHSVHAMYLIKKRHVSVCLNKS